MARKCVSNRDGPDFHRGEIDGSLGELNENEPRAPSLSIFRLSSFSYTGSFHLVSRCSYPFFPMGLLAVFISVSP